MSEAFRWKVMPWLRELRDRAAAEMNDMTPDEIIRASRKKAEVFHKEQKAARHQAEAATSGDSSPKRAAV